MKQAANGRFLSLCYHYIRPSPKDNLFPRILGNEITVFTEHLRRLSDRYSMVSPEEVKNLYYDGTPWPAGPKKIGLLFTFDDGLSDHYLAAKTLYDFGIKALFCIPTCILTDGLPISPTIVHYCLAKYGLAKFLAFLRESAQVFNITTEFPNYQPGDNVWKIIGEIKKKIKYDIDATNSRKILIDIYQKTLLRDHSDALEIMHLTKKQITEMLALGHHIGTHSHSHFSIASANLTEKELKKETTGSKQILETEFNTKVTAISYPYGESADCLKPSELLALDASFRLAFTIEPKLNGTDTNPLALGRYMPTSRDTSPILLHKLGQIEQGVKLCV